MIDRLKGVHKKNVADEGIKIACEQVEEFKEMKGSAWCAHDGDRVGAQSPRDCRTGSGAAADRYGLKPGGQISKVSSHAEHQSPGLCKKAGGFLFAKMNVCSFSQTMLSTPFNA